MPYFDRIVIPLEPYLSANSTICDISETLLNTFFNLLYLSTTNFASSIFPSLKDFSIVSETFLSVLLASSITISIALTFLSKLTLSKLILVSGLMESAVSLTVSNNVSIFLQRSLSFKIPSASFITSSITELNALGTSSNDPLVTFSAVLINPFWFIQPVNPPTFEYLAISNALSSVLPVLINSLAVPI